MLKVKTHYSAVATAILLSLVTWAMTLGSLTAAPTFTGNAVSDFAGTNAIKFDDLAGDTGVPIPPFPAGTQSGWDFTALYLAYDNATDNSNGYTNSINRDTNRHEHGNTSSTNSNTNCHRHRNIGSANRHTDG